MRVLLVFACLLLIQAYEFRQPVVEGQFYPSDKDLLTRDVDAFLSRAASPEGFPAPKALIAPHAGYLFSGGVAGSVIGLLPETVRRVVVLGPSHHVNFAGTAVPDLKTCGFSTCLGAIPLDKQVIRELVEQGAARPLPQAHAQEHSIEVMLPFLQRRLGDSWSLVPLALGSWDADAHMALAARLAALLQKDDGTVIVVSSDFSHGHALEEARRLDRHAVDQILALDAPGIRASECCGKVPILVLAEVARQTRLKPRLVEQATSGDVPAGRSLQDRVVGYAALAFYDPDALPDGPADSTPESLLFSSAEVLTRTERASLLGHARATIRAHLRGTAAPPLPTAPRAAPAGDFFARPLGCFVTLRKAGVLRGCIGHIWPVHPLVEAVQQNALHAALYDSRFTPLETEAELDACHVEISLLTPPTELAASTVAGRLRRLRPGIDGVVLMYGPRGRERQATFLPQVWAEFSNAKEPFLTHLCLKAGAPKACWRDMDATHVLVYQAVVFAEESEEGECKDEL